jgi:UDP-N-acetylglucosamine 2-epimerase (non-hydrolysing)
MHRPANVNETNKLKELMTEILINAKNIFVIFPILPRTTKNCKDYRGLNINDCNLHIVEPLGFLELNYLVQHSKAVIKDSSGITEETTVMEAPCLTFCYNTERPETVIIGTNELVRINTKNIKSALEKLLSGNWKKGGILDLWDGKAAGRIVNELIKIYG